MPDCAVQDIVVEAGAVVGVRTSQGDLQARAVVDAAGAWLRMVAARGHAVVKVVPTRHQLMA